MVSKDSENFCQTLESLEGRFLVASEMINDEIFDRSIVYICAHDEHGAIGVMINKTIGTFNLKDCIEEEAIRKKIKNSKIPLMYGGPVYDDKFIILATDKDVFDNTPKDCQVMVFTDCDGFFSDRAANINDYKFTICKGIAAWEPQQLEQEVLENSWFIATAQPDMIFSHRIQNKWERLMRDIGFSSFANFVDYKGRV